MATSYEQFQQFQRDLARLCRDIEQRMRDDGDGWLDPDRDPVRQMLALVEGLSLAPRPPTPEPVPLVDDIADIVLGYGGQATAREIVFVLRVEGRVITERAVRIALRDERFTRMSRAGRGRWRVAADRQAVICAGGPQAPRLALGGVLMGNSARP